MKAHRTVARLAILGVAVFVGPIFGQALDNFERLLMLQAGTRSLNDRDFYRYWAIQNAQSNQYRLQQQQAYRQNQAASNALREQQRLRGALTVPHRPTLGSQANPEPQQAAEPQIDPTVLQVWETFGVLLVPADPAALAGINPPFTAGMRIVATRAGGSAEQAGWLPDDILVGLHKYQVQDFANVVYVAQLPELPTLGPLSAIIVRGQQVYRTSVTPVVR